MPKPRTKRGSGRDERKRKHNGDDGVNGDGATKRQRHNEDHGEFNEHNANGDWSEQQNGPGEKEFFGMLADDEQEYFRRADEMLELNQFPTTEERDMFLESVFREAQGKELKLASSQSCSRLMERLIQLASKAQKKKLFEAFASHFLSLIQHRFASHCCEALFLRSASQVTEELAGFSGFVMDTSGADAQEQQPEASMEDLFLAALDELEGSLEYLITDRFASHTLRVLLFVLSGRPLADASTKTLIKSKRKEKISVVGAEQTDDITTRERAVPPSFSLAVKKIIQDSTAGMDATSIRVLAKHPIGNPTLQILLELDLSHNKAVEQDDSGRHTLLYQLLPDAPRSLSDPTSGACEFINGMIYDPIGSRIVETLITHSPAKIFRPMKHNIFLPRIQDYVRNDIACYAAIRVLNRLGKDDLADAAGKIAPTTPQLVTRSRFNVLKTLFERCAARNLQNEIKLLMKGLKEGCNHDAKNLIITLCSLKEDSEKKKTVEQISRNDYAIQSHGAQLLLTLLGISGPSKAVQESLLAVPDDIIIRLATTSMPTVNVLITALATPSANPAFHKSLVNTILPHIPELAKSQYGHNLVNEIAQIPSRGKERSVPPHMKEAIMTTLGQQEADLRESWMGRSVWRTWKGDTWKTRRGDWKIWMKEVGAEQSHGSGANGSALLAKPTGKKDVADKPSQDASSKEERPKKDKKKKKKEKSGDKTSEAAVHETE